MIRALTSFAIYLWVFSRLIVVNDLGERYRDTRKHPRGDLEVGIDWMDQQRLANVLLVVDAVLFHYLLEVLLEHTGDLNHELHYAQRGFLGRVLLALLDGYRCRLLLFLGHNLPHQFRGPVEPALSVVGAGAPGC